MGKKLNNIDENITQIILDSISDGVFTVGHDWRIMSFNRSAEEITGIPRDEAIGRHCWEVFRSNMCEGDCALKRTMEEGKSFVSTSTFIINSKKKRIPINVATSLLKNGNGEVLGGVETFRDHTLVEELRKELSSRYQMGDMVSRSPDMQTLFKVLPQIAESNSTVLIEGETGTGKELLARAIHDLSPRKKHPFVAINCGALPDTLLESELFGYKAGAFTNAVKDKPGLFEAAKGGTILLDEIGDTSSAFQVRLLRVIEEQKFQPLGSVTKIDADVRIIASTNKDLSLMVDRGEFRRDLFYRINVIKQVLPPLKERLEDIPLLVERFIAKMNNLRGCSVSGIEQEALEILMSHDYPGNIRELQNIIEHAFVLCSRGNIRLRHLPNHLTLQTFIPDEDKTLNDTIKSAEARVIVETLRQTGFNREATAEKLGMHKSTLFRKIKRLGIRLPKVDGRSNRKSTYAQ